MVLLAACAVIFIMHEAYAQQQLAEPAVNENINAELNSNGIAYITHEVFNKQLDSPVALIDGTVSEIRVTDMEGNAIEYTFSNSDGEFCKITKVSGASSIFKNMLKTEMMMYHKIQT